LNLLARSELIGHTFDIHNQSHTSQDPLGRWVLSSLHLSSEHVSAHTIRSLVNWALVDVLLFATSCGDACLGSNDGHDRELNLGEGLVESEVLDVPAGALDLETEDPSTVLAVGDVLFPVPLALNFCHNTGLVKLDLVLAGENLLDGSEERLRVEQSVDEGHLGHACGVILPEDELLEALLDVSQPGAETTL
jgi:hypothetical protein